MKKLTIVAAIHGDETYGIDLYKKFKKKFPELRNCVQLIIGNKKAYKSAKRFIDSDLNRHFNTGVNNHETTELSRVESEINEFKPDYVIDVHTTRRSSGIFILSDRLNPIRRKICKTLNVSDICIMRNDIVKNSFIGNHYNAVSVEYSLNSISELTTLDFIEAVANLVQDAEVSPRQQSYYVINRLITREEWTSYQGLKNKDHKPEGIALMAPKNKSEMNAEYYGFWCKSEQVIPHEFT